MALLQTLTDNFNDNSIDGTKWQTFVSAGGSVTETNQRMQITAANANTSGIYSPTDGGFTYDFRGSYVFIEVIQAPSNGGNAFLQVVTASSKDVEFAILTTTLTARKLDSTYTNIATATYNNVTHRFLRIREASGTVFWDYSADGVNWTNLGSNVTGFTDLGTVQVVVYGDAPASVADTFYIDNFNTAPAATTTSTSSSISTSSTSTSASTSSTSSSTSVSTSSTSSSTSKSTSTSSTSSSISTSISTSSTSSSISTSSTSSSISTSSTSNSTSISTSSTSSSTSTTTAISLYMPVARIRKYS